MTFPSEDLVHEGYELDGQLGYMKNAIVQIPFLTLSEVLEKPTATHLLVPKSYPENLVKNWYWSFYSRACHVFKNVCVQLGF